jgi:hypothetical protein
VGGQAHPDRPPRARAAWLFTVPTLQPRASRSVPRSGPRSSAARGRPAAVARARRARAAADPGQVPAGQQARQREQVRRGPGDERGGAGVRLQRHPPVARQTGAGRIPAHRHDYQRKVWWRGTSRHGLKYEPNPFGQPHCPAAVAPPMGNFPNWSAQVRHALACGTFHVAGRQWIGGIDTIKIVTSRRDAWGVGSQALWVNPATYLPVRAAATTAPGRAGTAAGARAEHRGHPAGFPLSTAYRASWSG